MDTISRGLTLSRFLAALSLFTALSTTNSPAAGPKQARVTQVNKNVRLLPPNQSARKAALHDEVHDGTVVRTGADSRSELSFTGQALARLGSNTAFSFDKGTRNLKLEEGAVLFQIPKKAGRAVITTGTMAASIGGTTGIIERYGSLYVKVLFLQGEARVYLTDRVGESILMRAGQILITKPEAKALPEPAHYDIDHLYKTSALVAPFPPLPNQDLIFRAIQKQKNDPRLISTNLVIVGRGTLVSLVDPATQKTTPSPRPVPSPKTQPEP